MMEGWTSRRRTGALGFGSALHVGMAAWYRSGDPGEALNAINQAWPDSMPIDDWRTKEKCLVTMAEYIKQYPSETFKIVGAPDNPVIEVPFTLDFGMYLPCTHCSLRRPDDELDAVCHFCGLPKEPLEYGGIYDMLVDFGGQLFVVDHKSTSVLGPSYFNQFNPNNQMTGYIWAASQLSGAKVTGAIINAIGVMKTGKTKFEREITSRSPEAIEEWKRNVYVEACNIKEHERLGFFPMRTQACTMYGLCEYHGVHTLQHAAERVKRLEADYVREEWDYEMRDG
jgi:hypothetical protein